MPNIVTTSWSDAIQHIEVSLTENAKPADVKFALPPANGTISDTDIPKPLVEIANASVVFNITKLTGLEKATFSYGGIDRGTLSTSTFRPRVGELMVVQGQGLSLSVSPESGCCAKEGRMEVDAQLIGDFCKRVPTESVCKGHNAQATARPPSQGPGGSASNHSTSSAGGSPGSNGGTNVTTPSPSTPGSASARRVAAVSTVVSCLALAFITTLQ